MSGFLSILSNFVDCLSWCLSKVVGLFVYLEGLSIYEVIFYNTGTRLELNLPNSSKNVYVVLLVKAEKYALFGFSLRNIIFIS